MVVNSQEAGGDSNCLLLFGNRLNHSGVLLWWLVVLFLVHLLTALFSEGMYHCDEHFQVVEFLGFKLGAVPEQGLAWEYASRIRPWIQPISYFPFVKLLQWSGISNPFHLVTATRMFTAILNFSAISAVCWSVFRLLGSEAKAFWVAFLFSSFYFFPSFHVRTSSEAFSTGFLMFAYALVVRNPISLARFFWVGFLLAIAFSARFQTAFAGAGMALWLFFNTEEKKRCLVGGVFGATFGLLLAALSDRWGYGDWVFPAYRYFIVNILEGRASGFGVSPWWDYFRALIKAVAFPYGVFLVASLALVFARPRNTLLAGIVVPFFLAHSLIGHKETRFLYPICWALWLAFLLWIVPVVFCWRERSARTRHWTKIAVATHLGVNAILMLKKTFLPIDPMLNLLERVGDLTEGRMQTLFVLGGANPYSLGCDGQERKCNVRLVAQFLLPKNLRVECADSMSQVSTSKEPRFLVIETLMGSPQTEPEAPSTCKLLSSTRGWPERLLSTYLTPGLRGLLFKGYKHTNLWQCHEPPAL